MKDNGRTTSQVVRGNSSILMEICMRDNGLRIKQMDSAFIFTRMEPNIKGIGKMIFNMA
jgi:hypothetical protein